MSPRSWGRREEGGGGRGLADPHGWEGVVCIIALVRLDAGRAVGTPAEVRSPAAEICNTESALEELGLATIGAKINILPFLWTPRAMAKRVRDSQFYSERGGGGLLFGFLAGHAYPRCASMNSKIDQPSICWSLNIVGRGGGGYIWTGYAYSHNNRERAECRHGNNQLVRSMGENSQKVWANRFEKTSLARHRPCKPHQDQTQAQARSYAPGRGHGHRFSRGPRRLLKSGRCQVRGEGGGA